MRIRCLHRRLDAIENEIIRARLQRSMHIEEDDPDLVEGSIYHVVAIETRDNGLWYLVHVTQQALYPFPFPAEFFEVVDGTLPSGWQVSIEPKANGMVIQRISFPAWASDGSFYERLVDGEEQALLEYGRNREAP